MAQHTPGPWKVEYSDKRSDEPTICYCGDYRIVADGFRGYDSHAECDVDARLIAAAPDLPTALQGLLDRMTFDARIDTQDRMDAMRAASAAIAKSHPKICDCERSHNGIGLSGRECDCPAL